jgi:hypothetical protein
LEISSKFITFGTFTCCGWIPSHVNPYSSTKCFIKDWLRLHYSFEQTKTCITILDLIGPKGNLN